VTTIKKAGLWLGLLMMIACSLTVGKQETAQVYEESLDSLVAPTIPQLHGVPLNNSRVIDGRVRWNQTLSVILDDYGVSHEALYALDHASRKVYDVRKLKAGSTYKIIEDTISGTASHFIFEPDPTEVVVYQLADSVTAYSIKKPVDLIEKNIAAVINSSVYESVLEAGGSPLLVSKLVDILAWQVDFFRIQKGDKFKVIYEEEQVDGTSIGIRRIKGVFFEHFSQPYYGIYFGASDGKEDYFDEVGNSMRKTFLRAPLDYSRISSRYTPRRYHPVQKRYKAHLGTDYAAPVGTPIRSVGDGVILEARYGKYNGNYVKVRHNSNYTTQYLHMQKIKRGIRPGVTVKQGQVIGFVGQTGLANGPHLCYRFWKNGRQVDALNVDLPPSEPINPNLLDAYLHHKNVILHQLEQIQYPVEQSQFTASAVQ
jgi:murein DD-endopeptidase MepM/ murein hydrolase activator NlpD